MTEVERDILLEEELDTVHPRGTEAVEVRKRRGQRLHLVGDEARHNLDRQRGDVEVRHDIGLLAGLLDGDASDAAGVGLEGLDGRVWLELDALLGEVLYPRREPHFACGTAEQAVEASPSQDAEDQLQKDVSGGPCASLLSPDGYERSREALCQECLIDGRVA